MESKRVEALADGIFAIAMTLLILQVRVPQLEQPVTQRALWNALTRLTPHVMGYFVSFVLLGALWVGHHAQFHFIRSVDRALLWLNIAFLACIGFIPFSTALFSEYHRQPLAAAVYSATMLIGVGFLYAQWEYATTGRRHVADDLEEAIVTAGKRRMWIGFAIYLGAALVSFVNSAVGLALFVVLPIIYLMPGPMDRHLKR